MFNKKKESKKETIKRLEGEAEALKQQLESSQKSLDGEREAIKKEREALTKERKLVEAARADQDAELNRLQKRREKAVEKNFERRVQEEAKQVVEGAQNKQVETVHNLIIGSINRVPAHFMVYVMALDLVKWQIIRDARVQMGVDVPPQPPQPQPHQGVPIPPPPQPHQIRQGDLGPEVYVSE